MEKKWISKVAGRAIAGALIGLGLSCLIGVLISFKIGDGNYYAVSPTLVKAQGSELNAVLVQMLVSMVYGAVWAASSFIYETEKGSLLQKTLLHYILNISVTLPVFHIMRWDNGRLSGMANTFIGVSAVYVLLWVLRYLIVLAEMKRINGRLPRR